MLFGAFWTKMMFPCLHGFIAFLDEFHLVLQEPPTAMPKALKVLNANLRWILPGSLGHVLWICWERLKVVFQQDHIDNQPTAKTNTLMQFDVLRTEVEKDCLANTESDVVGLVDPAVLGHHQISRFTQIGNMNDTVITCEASLKHVPSFATCSVILAVSHALLSLFLCRILTHGTRCQVVLRCPARKHLKSSQVSGFGSLPVLVKYSQYCRLDRNCSQTCLRLGLKEGDFCYRSRHPEIALVALSATWWSMGAIKWSVQQEVGRCKMQDHPVACTVCWHGLPFSLGQPSACDNDCWKYSMFQR